MHFFDKNGWTYWKTLELLIETWKIHSIFLSPQYVDKSVTDFSERKTKLIVNDHAHLQLMKTGQFANVKLCSMEAGSYYHNMKAKMVY